jgi:hypothetical protein
MNQEKPTLSVPRPIRRAAMVCLLFSAFVGFFSLNEAMHLEELKPEETTKEAVELSVEAQMQPLMKAALEAQVTGLLSMKTSRQWILGGLWVASIFSLVGAMRLVRPSAFPKDKALVLLGRSTFAAALLRVVDGAQMTVIAKKMGLAAAPHAAQVPQLHSLPEGGLEFLFMAISAGLTLLVAGGYLTLSMYFRSDKAQQILSAPSAGPA